MLKYSFIESWASLAFWKQHFKIPIWRKERKYKQREVVFIRFVFTFVWHFIYAEKYTYYKCAPWLIFTNWTQQNFTSPPHKTPLSFLPVAAFPAHQCDNHPSFFQHRFSLPTCACKRACVCVLCINTVIHYVESFKGNQEGTFGSKYRSFCNSVVLKLGHTFIGNN